jgi:pimeloyl-ACP methyl ester carboxylesterase
VAGRARLAVTVAAVAGGIAAGYLAERRALRPRLVGDRTDEPPLGSIEGELTEIRGPDGLRVTVESYGSPDAPQIVFSHGWVCTGRVWHEQVRALADRYRLVTYDQPGHGRTSPPRSERYDLDLFGDTLAEVVAQATRPGPLVLCGHSLGGMTIMNGVRRNPDLARRLSGVALVSTTSRSAIGDAALGIAVNSLSSVERLVARVLPGSRAPSAAALAAYRSSTDLSFLMTRTLGLAHGADPRHVDFTEQLLLDADIEMVRGVVKPVLELDEDEGLACLTVPTRIVCGTHDRLTPIALSRRMAERCPTAELTEVEGVGHMAMLEAADVVNDVLETLVLDVSEAA